MKTSVQTKIHKPKVLTCRRLKWVLVLCTFLVLLAAPAGGENEFPFALAEGIPSQDLLTLFREKGSMEYVQMLGTANRLYPVFIFIPGIMGSKLEIKDPAGSGKYLPIWGRVGIRDLTADTNYLHYDPAQKNRIQASPLHEIELMRQHFDIYGDFITTMTNLDWTGLKHFLPFGYDWRQDNRQSAKDFDDKIKSEWLDQLTGRPVVVIAHSMGGLVFKWWYRNHYMGNEKDYGFSIDRVFFLGTPHSGSPTALGAVCEGYNLLSQYGSWMQGVDQRTLSRALNNHAFTFPSVYQLLPIDENMITYMDENIPGFKERKVNIFSAEIWKRMNWPKNDTLGVSRDQFYQTLQPLLDQARNFHEDIRKNPMVENGVYFFSFNHETPTGLKVVRNNKDRIRCQIDKEKKGGDGTVPTDIARNWDQRPEFERCKSLTDRHMDLPKDPQFLYYVASFQERFDAKRSEFLAREIILNRNLAQAFADKNLLLSMPLRKQAAADVDAEIIAKANNIIFAMANLELDSPEQFDRTFYAAARNAPDSKTRSHFYATYIASGTKVTGDGTSYKSQPVRMGWAANNLGHNLTLYHYWEDAMVYFKKAAGYVDALKGAGRYADLKNTVETNLNIVEKVAQAGPNDSSIQGQPPQ